MSRINRDTFIAILLMIVWSVFFWASFDFRQIDYGTMGAEVWPRGILIILFVLTAVYLFQSIKAGPDAVADEPFTVRGWLRKYHNPLWCYALYFLFLLTLPVLGMLIGGVALVFCLLTVLGERTPRDLLIHAVIAVVSITGMWALFTYALGVILPQGMIFTTL
ncbi:tripartite tricarboxylate transporter TctB family protein [Thalassospiraceae bacterium LMO-JJ14]|nr:tripartite tricarboxylate transporter TctB family protein [Thalassospiraceae bacterium LMO-JJ14]